MKPFVFFVHPLVFFVTRGHRHTKIHARLCVLAFAYFAPLRAME